MKSFMFHIYYRIHFKILNNRSSSRLFINSFFFLCESGALFTQLAITTPSNHQHHRDESTPQRHHRVEPTRQRRRHVLAPRRERPRELTHQCHCESTRPCSNILRSSDRRRGRRASSPFSSRDCSCFILVAAFSQTFIWK